jgi:hypothetical protein
VRRNTHKTEPEDILQSSDVAPKQNGESVFSLMKSESPELFSRRQRAEGIPIFNMFKVYVKVIQRIPWNIKAFLRLDVIIS